MTCATNEGLKDPVTTCAPRPHITPLEPHFISFLFETESLHVARAILELTMKTRLAYNSQLPDSVFQSAGINVVSHND